MEEDFDISASAYGGSQFDQENTQTFVNMRSGEKTPKFDRKKFNEQTLSPLTIKQIVEAEDPKFDESLTINGRQVSQVSVVGVIVRIDVQSTHTSYVIEDGTSQILVKIWNSGESKNIQDRNLQNLKEQMYVRVIGRVNVFKGQKSLVGFAVLPITDFNDVTLHFIECIYSHLTSIVPQNSNNASQTTLNSQFNNNYNNNNNNNNNNNPINTSIPLNTLSVSTLEQKILSIVSSPHFISTDAGCFIEDLFKVLPNENVTRIRESIEKLLEEGTLYTTIDDEHIKSSVSM